VRQQIIADKLPASRRRVDREVKCLRLLIALGFAVYIGRFGMWVVAVCTITINSLVVLAALGKVYGVRCMLS
jgi:hypothetical protein